MLPHWKGLAMTEHQPRAGVHAWDEGDARSIASNTPSYGGALFRSHSTFTPILPVPPRAAPSTTTRIASAMMARFRFRPRPEKFG